MSQQINISIGVFIFNEELNIKKCLNSILKQKTDIAQIKEILVISSGSNDRSNKIVREFEKKDNRIKLVEQLRRNGKSAAINLFLKKSKTNIVLISSGDLRWHSNTAEEISLPFLHNDVGMVGAHPIPVNTQHSQVGDEIRLLWQLHHEVSMEHPKCGELVAFRKVIHAIPKHSAVDEATIEVLLKIIGFKVIYAPRAIVYNNGPKTTKDFLVQRRRVYSGHKWVSDKYNYQVSTMNSSNTTRIIIRYLLSKPKDIKPMIKLITLEFYGRLLGWIDYNVLGKNPYIWKMVER